MIEKGANDFDGALLVANCSGNLEKIGNLIKKNA